MNDIDRIVEDLQANGYLQMPDEEAAIRLVVPDVRMLRSALTMANDGSPSVLNNIIRQAVESAKLKRPTTPSPTAGGEKKMVQDPTSQPKPGITEEELVKMIPQRRAEVTDYTKAPKWEPKIGDAIIARLKLVHEGGYETPLVIAKEWAEFKEGKTGEIQKSDLAIPTWAVSRALKENNVKLVPDFVYYFEFTGERETQFPNPYKQGVVLSLGQSFPGK